MLLFLADLGGSELLLLLLLAVVPLLLIIGLLLLWRLLRPRRSAGSVPPGSLFVADELRKLEELRDRGAITPTEFDAQKLKLLR